MIEKIEQFLLQKLGRTLCVFVCSMIPIIELRGSIPLGAGLGLPFWQNFIISVIGNMIPVSFILLFIRSILSWMAKSRVKWISKTANWVYGKADKKKAKIEKYSFWGLFLFVAIPIPGTGAWTGSLIAALLNLKFHKSVLAVFLGVLTAGVIMSLISYGIFSLIAGLF